MSMNDTYVNVRVRWDIVECRTVRSAHSTHITGQVTVCSASSALLSFFFFLFLFLFFMFFFLFLLFPYTHSCLPLTPFRYFFILPFLSFPFSLHFNHSFLHFIPNIVSFLTFLSLTFFTLTFLRKSNLQPIEIHLLL
jgi:hypothetical protein